MAQAQTTEAQVKPEPEPKKRSASIDFSKDVEVGWFSNPASMNTGATTTYQVGGFTGGTGVGTSGNHRIRKIYRMTCGAHRMLVEVNSATGDCHWIIVAPGGGVDDVMDEGWKVPQ
jgi:hypothetical protein